MNNFKKGTNKMLKFETPISHRRYVESSGKRSCIMGYLGKGLEVWSYPVKILRNLKTNVFIRKTSERFELTEIVKNIIIKPEFVEIIYVHPLLTIEEILFSPLDFPGTFVIYQIDSFTDFEMIFSFFPELNLMWPGAIGGQYSYWSNELSGFIISEPTENFSAVIRVKEGHKNSYEGDHSFSDVPYSIHVNISKGKSEKIFSVVGGIFDRKSCENLLKLEENIETEIKKAEKHYKNFLSKTLSVETPDKELNEFFNWGKVSILKGMVINPVLGEGLTAGIGVSGRSTRPGFNWFFAGDFGINTLGILGYGDYEIIKKNLEFYIKYQRDDGRIPHEISQSAGLIDWFDKYGNFAYLHADTTAWYLLAFAMYVIESGDFEFAEKMKEKIIKAYRFYDGFFDESGMILNQKAGLGALEVGEFKRPKYDIYTNGIYLAALKKLIPVMAELKEEKLAEEMQKKVEKISQKIEDLWINDKNYYSLSVSSEGKLLDLLTPWPAFPISLGLLNRKRAKIHIKKLKSSSIFTPWGVRSVEKGKNYDPLNYNFGSVWYFINGFVSLAAYNLEDSIFGWQLIKAAIRAFFEEGSTHLQEVYSGDRFVPLNTAVAHQLFAIGPVLMAILRGTFGIEKDCITSTLTFRPQIPAHWNYFKLKNIEFNDTKINIEFERKGNISTMKFTNLKKVPIKIVLSLKKPLSGEINLSYSEGSAFVKDEKDEIKICFELKDEKILQYSEIGFKFSVEYENLKYGFSNDNPVLYHLKDESELHVLGNNNAIVYLWSNLDFQPKPEELIADNLEKKLYRFSISSGRELQVSFFKNKEG
ncbi:MAG: hypothetical protein PWQ48_1664 [Thermotogaceae bacterium]|jgi:glycogen debranching enzyme|nr:hypothetical protein [Thermotogaceae bacterium]